MKSPFKFLDSYTKDDRNIFFGRDREIEELYQKVFDSKLLLVYGVSGTGKSSLIHCGLANKFNEADWLPLVIRRGRNIIESMASVIRSASVTPQQGNISLPVDFKKGVRSLYLDHYKPVFFIFDQFEELFIFGDKEERKTFVQIVKSLIESDLQCRLIFVMREEYMAGVTEFEKYIPTFFSNRVRIEKMSHLNALETINEPCQKFNISMEEGFAEALLEKLSPENTDVELTYLQVFLDKIFRLAQNENESGRDQNQISFTLALLKKTGNVSDLLGSFLDEQIKELDDPETGLSILKAFVSIKGTKKQLTVEEVSETSRSFGNDNSDLKITEHLQKFINLRILRDKDENAKYELRHDSLAFKIYEKITLVEKETLEIIQFIDNAFSVYEKRGKLLTSEDIKYLAPYEDKLYLSKSSETFITRSKNEITRSKRRRRNFAGFVAIALIIVLTGFTFWALSEKKKSNRNFLKAQANNFNYLAKEISEKDPTIAFRLVEHAISIDSSNRDYLKNLIRIYSENNFYKIVSRQEGFVFSAVFSPDGKYILTGCEDNTAQLLDLKGDIILCFRGHTQVVSSVAFSPDGKYILTGSEDKTARIWDTRGHVIQVLSGHKDGITSVAYSPDGKSILTGSYDKTARLWDFQGKVIREFKGHNHILTSVAFSPDGNNILTCSWDSTARLWNLHGIMLKVFKVPEQRVLAGVFSPDGKTILTSSFDKTIRLWDLKGNLIREFKGHKQGVNSVVFSPDGQNILSGSDDNLVYLWDLHGNIIQVFRGHEKEIASVAFSPDGSCFISGSYDKTARLWNIKGNNIKIFEGNDQQIFSVAISSDGDKILTGSWSNKVYLWDIRGTVIQEFKGHNGKVWAVDISNDGKNILTGSEDKTARLWNLQGKVIQVFKGHDNRITSVAFSPDNRSILTGSLDMTARLWNKQGDLIQKFVGHGDGISSIAFSPDGKSVLTGSDDRTVRLWNLQGKLLQEYKSSADGITSVAFSPDGKYILAGSWNNKAWLWNTRGNLLQIFRGHESYILSVAFSPNSRSILTGSADRTARLWDLQGNVIQIFKGHEGYITSVAFAADGKSILTGSDDKTARLWEIKRNLKDFQKENEFQELSIEQKLGFGILEFNDILKLKDEKDLSEGAIYFFGKIISAGEAKRIEYLKNAEILFQKGLKINNYSCSIARGLTELINYKQQLSIEAIKQEINRYFKIIIESDDKYELERDLVFYADRTDSTTISFGYPEKANIIGEKLLQLSKNDKDIRTKISSDLNNLAQQLIYLKQYKNSLTSSKIAITSDSTYQYTYPNLAISYILNDMYSDAEKEYLKWKDKPWTENDRFETFRDAFLIDIAALEKKGITHPDFEKVKELLKK